MRRLATFAAAVTLLRSSATATAAALFWMLGIGAAQITTTAPAAISAPTHADALVVLSAVGMRQVMLALSPIFERETGRRLAVTFDSGAAIGQRVRGGEAVDVVLVPRGVLNELVGAQAVRPPAVDIATSVAGLAVRKGVPAPDISTPEALRRTLLAAKSVARPDPAQGGSSGVHIAQVLERLGIADELRSRTLLASNPDREEEMPGAFVATGRAEIALHQVQELMAVTGIDVVGPLPPDLRGSFLFSVGILTASTQTQLAKQLLDLLTRPQTLRLIESKGMYPPPR
jgi:molybdate transport system substrate-binding protein